jgi:hypothetical protein
LAWPRSGDKDVCGLDIPVNDSLAVGGSECVSNLNSPFKHLFERHWLSADAMLQRGAFHEFHRDERLTVLFADFVDGANVGMIQRGRRTRLSAKTFEHLWDLGEVVRKKFERDKPAEGGVLGFIDDPHAAAAQLFDDSVVRNGLADHRTDDGDAVVIREAFKMDEWFVSRAGILLFRIEKQFEVHL